MAVAQLTPSVGQALHKPGSRVLGGGFISCTKASIGAYTGVPSLAAQMLSSPQTASPHGSRLCHHRLCHSLLLHVQQRHGAGHVTRVQPAQAPGPMPRQAPAPPVNIGGASASCKPNSRTPPLVARARRHGQEAAGSRYRRRVQQARQAPRLNEVYWPWLLVVWSGPIVFGGAELLSNIYRGLGPLLLAARSALMLRLAGPLPDIIINTMAVAAGALALALAGALAVALAVALVLALKRTVMPADPGGPSRLAGTEPPQPQPPLEAVEPDQEADRQLRQFDELLAGRDDQQRTVWTGSSAGRGGDGRLEGWLQGA